MNIQLTKSPIGLDGVPAAETVLSHVDGERGELIIAGEHVGDLAGKSSFEGVTARLWNGATGKTRSEANVRAELGAARERAFARLPELLPATRGMSIVDGFRAAVAGLRAEAGLEHEATIVGAFPVIAGALVQRAKGREPIAPDPNAWPCRRYAVDAARLQGRAARGHRARRLSRHGLRSRHERLDLYDARGRLDAGRSVRRRHRRLLRADRSAAWRRAGAGAGNAGCDRHARADQAMGRRCAFARRTLDGVRPPRLPGARSPRRCAEGARSSGLPPRAPTFPLRARSRPISGRRCGGRIRTGRWRPMSSSSPRSCSMRWQSRGRPSRRSLRSHAPPAGPRMHASSSGRGG